MSDEQDQKNGEIAAWSMPEPVFRSSEGKPARKEAMVDPQEDVPTEPGFTDDEEDTLVLPRTETAPERPIAKKGGCLRMILSAFGLIGFLVLLVLGLLIYLLVFYRPADTGTF